MVKLVPDVSGTVYVSIIRASSDEWKRRVSQTLNTIFSSAGTLGCASTNHKYWLGRKLRRGRKQGITELWNAGYECMRIAMLNVFADKQSIMNRQNFCCISIR
jgi:hypothetical protein